MRPIIHYFGSRRQALFFAGLLARVSGTGGKKAFGVIEEPYSQPGNRVWALHYRSLPGRTADNALIQSASCEMLSGYIRGYLAASKAK